MVYVRRDPNGKITCRSPYPLPGMEPAASSMGRSPVIVTLSFDDGLASHYEIAFPILTKYGIRATFFTVGGWLGGSGRMTAAQIREMARYGQEIGCHSYSHPDLTSLSPEQVIEEFAMSKDALQEATGFPVLTHAYPFGAVNYEVANIAGAFYEAARGTRHKVATKYGQKTMAINIDDGGDALNALYNVSTHQPEAYVPDLGLQGTIDRIMNDIDTHLNGEPAWLNYFGHGLYKDDDPNKIPGRLSESEFEAIVAALSERKKYNDIEIVPFYEGARRMRTALGTYWYPSVVTG